jgi:signal peptidase I
VDVPDPGGPAGPPLPPEPPGPTNADNGSPKQPRKAKKNDPVRSTVEWIVVIAGAVLVAVIVKAFVLEAFWIPSESMEPTLLKGDRVLVNKLSGEPSRGDVVVFERPPEGTFTFKGCNGGPDVVIPRTRNLLDPSVVDLIKRVIALPGDTVERRDDGTVWVNGNQVKEPYLSPGTRTPAFFTSQNGPQCLTVPTGEVFVLGDNRNNSSASNVFGPIEESSIVGHAFVRIWPPTRVGGL